MVTSCLTDVDVMWQPLSLSLGSLNQDEGGGAKQRGTVIETPLRPVKGFDESALSDEVIHESSFELI